jgi:hypothetical protein
MVNSTPVVMHKKGHPPKRGVITAISGAVLAFVCFASAWITFSGKKVASQTIKGFDVAGQLSGIGKLAPYALLLLAVVTLGLAVFAWKHKHDPSRDGFSFMAVGAIGLFLLFWQVSTVQSHILEGGYTTTHYEMGLWGIILGFFLVLLGGILILREASRAFHTASGRALLYAILILGAIIAIYPFFWMISTSLMEFDLFLFIGYHDDSRIRDDYPQLFNDPG